MDFLIQSRKRDLFQSFGKRVSNSKYSTGSFSPENGIRITEFVAPSEYQNTG
jgi:hypothetical protein